MNILIRANSFLKNNRLIVIISFVNFLIIYLSAFTPGYSYFIDELYYVACAMRPAFGYVDHPPLAPLILTINIFLTGSSIYSIRFLPAVVSSISVLFTGLLAKEVGGNRFAQSLAAFTIMTIPVFLSMASFYSMNVFEPLFCIVIFYELIKIIKTGYYRNWITIGIFIGLGLLNKHTMGVFVVFLIISILISNQRKILFTKYFLISILIAFILFLPNIIWEILNNYPTLEFYVNIMKAKNVPMSPFNFIVYTLFAYSFFSVLVWLPGLLITLVKKEFRIYNFISLTFLITFLFFLITKQSRIDRVSFVFPPIIAFGALYIERILIKRNIYILKPLFFILISLSTILIIPTIMPLTSPQTAEVITNKIGMNTEIERGNKPKVPQLLADRIGWEERAGIVIKAYEQLNKDEQDQALIYASNYGQAGAIELYGKRHNIPPVICGQNTYYLWSKKIKKDANILVALTHPWNIKSARELFEVVDTTGYLYINDYCTSHENNLTILICRKPKKPLQDIIDEEKNYY